MPLHRATASRNPSIAGVQELLGTDLVYPFLIRRGYAIEPPSKRSSTSSEGQVDAGNKGGVLDHRRSKSDANGNKQDDGEMPAKHFQRRRSRLLMSAERWFYLRQDARLGIFHAGALTQVC